MKNIKLTKGKCSIVDDDIFDYLNQFKWHYDPKGYAARSINGHTEYMHRIILDVPPGMCTDHINHNGLDNRKVNLRICDKSQNMANSISRRSLNKGVTYNKQRNKWVARICLHRKEIWIGDFDEYSLAVNAYAIKAKELFGDFAFTGFEANPK